MAGSKTCDGTQVSTCTTDGQAFMTTACPSAMPLCIGKGSCVQCVHSSDCPVAPECNVAVCNTGSGTCSTAFTAPRTPCSGGICDENGNCGPAPKCGDGIVNQTLEQCDDSTWTCDSSCQKRTAYTSCRTADDCSLGETCFSNFNKRCSKHCDPGTGNVGMLGAATGRPSPPPPLTAFCNKATPICIVVGCRNTADCPPGQLCTQVADPNHVLPYTSGCANP